MSGFFIFNFKPGARVAQWVRSLDIATHTSLSPIRHGFAPSFVNLQKGCTRLAAASDKVYQLFAQGQWFSSGTPVSSTTKTDRHDIAEILLKVALITKYSKFQTNQVQILFFFLFFKIRMKPGKVCRLVIACAVLHNIAIKRNEPLVDNNQDDHHHDQPQIPPFNGQQDGRGDTFSFCWILSCLNLTPDYW